MFFEHLEYLGTDLGARNATGNKTMFHSIGTCTPYVTGGGGQYANLKHVQDEEIPVRGGDASWWVGETSDLVILVQGPEGNEGGIGHRQCIGCGGAGIWLGCLTVSLGSSVAGGGL